MKNIRSRELNRKRIAILFGILIAIILLVIFVLNRSKNTEITTDPAILRAMTYTEYTDDDGHKEVYEVNQQTGEETENVIENVEFSAFFLQDLDDDGLAESIAGTCNQIGSDATLYMELNVLTEGSLEDAVITINADNFYLQTALPADDEIKTNAISSNTSNIYFNTISNGTQKLITGNVRSGDYSSKSGILSALSNNVNNYSAVNTVTLTGTYVAEDGTKTKISKTVEITVDWYNTPVASMPTYITEKENLNQTQNLSTAVDEDAGTFKVKIKVGMEETESKSLLEEAYIYGEIPELNGYSATAVSITGTNVEYTWDEETQEYTAQVVAETDESGNIIQNAYYGIYSSGSTYYRYNYFDFEITYPLDAYYAVGSETIVYQLTANGYYMAYNNPNEEFDNPVQSNIASGTFITTIERGGGDVIAFETYVGTYRSSSPKGWVVSKENPLSIYNGYAEGEDIEDTYLVTWQVARGADGTIDGVIVAETKLDEESKNVDYLTTATGEQISMEDITSNVGIYFDYASNMFGEDGWIKVYNDETDELIVTFTNDGADDTENWNSYSSSKPYYYEESVKHIRIETSSAATNSSLLVYNVKELDDEYLTTNYTEEYFDTLSYISTTLVGYAIYGGDTDETYIKTDIDQAYYEAPYAYANLGISESAYSTQETTENVDITITTNTSAFNQIKWVNGSFLIEIPEDIINLEINNININNSNVEITNYEKYEENGKSYIKIDTENEEEETYTITLNVNITPNPKMVTTTESFILYYYNENAVAYETNTIDTYDINNNLSTEDTIGQASLNVNLVAPSSLLTSESITNYDEEGNETVAPNVAEVDKEQSSADINIAITNNYSSTISGIVILGRVPFEGNTYIIRGKDLGSTFTVTMTGEIELPEGLTGTIYYSTNGEASKDLSDEENNWVTADEVTDWSEIKSYLIDISENTLEKGDSYTITYNVNLPSGLDYNDVTYSHHAVWFNLDTENGKYATYTEPNKVGIMIAKQYDLELTKYQINTDYLVAGATYKVTDLTTGNSKTATTDENGLLTINGLYVERTYSLQEIKSSSDYELNSDVITFTCSVDDDYNLVIKDQEGNYLNIEVVQGTEDEEDKLKVEVEDEVKATIQIAKTDAENSQKLQNVKFKITGKNYANGKTISTDSEGIATLSGLTIGETYTIEETKTQDGYYLIQEPIEVKVNSNNDGTYYLEIVSDEENVATIGDVTYSNGIPTLTINIENEKIPIYSLELLKIEDNDEEQIGLSGARFELYSEDTGSYTYLNTNGEGKLTFEGLYNYVDGKYISGIYKLTEIIAPNGYVISGETIEFYVELTESGGYITHVINENELYSLVSYDQISTTDSINITIQNSPQFKLTKISKDNGTGLAGAKFIIYEVDVNGNEIDYAKDTQGNYVDEQDENGDYIITTDENGEYTVALAGGFYKLVEIEAPDGYELAEDEYFVIEGYDAYKISTVEEFLEFANDGSTYEGEVVEITSDLDFTGVEYSPKEEFNGTLIGNGHVISNLTINSVNEISSTSEDTTNIKQYAGLFEKTNNAIINGIELQNLSIENTGSSETEVTTENSYFYRYIGGIAGFSTNTTITNCSITGESSINITAENEEEYTYSYLYFGGIIGYGNNCTIEYCHTSEDMNITEISDLMYSYIGGISGYINDGTLTNSYNEADITGESGTENFVAGIVGYADSNITITNVYNTGNITSSTETSYIGGILGYSNYSRTLIENCYNKGELIVSEKVGYIGGIIGYSNYDDLTEINNCYNEGHIESISQTMLSRVGGIIGQVNYSTLILEKCYNIGELGSANKIYYLGGIIAYGIYSDITVENCYNTGQLNNEVVFGGIGGIAYRLSYGTAIIENCYNSGDMISSYCAYCNIGGIISIGDTVTIINCYNIGNMEIEQGGVVHIGGIAGLIANSSIINCYNLGNITLSSSLSTNYIGGILGITDRLSDDYGNESSIINCYNIGNIEVDDTTYTGKIVGCNPEGEILTIDKCYYSEESDIIDVGSNEGTIIGGATLMSNEKIQSSDFATLLNDNQSSIETDYELLEWTSTETYPEYENDLSFELDIQLKEEAVITSVKEVTIEDELAKHIITTEIAENSEGERTGGTITGSYTDDYLEENNIQYVETVTNGYDATENIVITPDEGYIITSITLDGESVSYIPDENGVVTLPALENVTEDHHYVVTFETGYAQIIVHHILLDQDGNVAYDESGNIIYVADDELQTGKVGSSYTTSPQIDLTEYSIATNGDLSEETINELKEAGYIISDDLDEDEYYIPSNSYGTYISGETIEITYYYVAKEVPLTVYHYIEGTTTAVPTSSDDVETVTTDSGAEGEKYETTSLSDDELAEKYELVSIPENATGIYEYSENIVIYYYAIVSRDLSLVKTDENGNSLSGVTFTITGIDEDTEGYEESFTTSSSGTITTTLEYGTYTVQETGTLEGYDLDETIYTIKITKEGISLITYDEEGEEISELLTLNDEGAYELEVENNTTKGNVIVHHYIYDETQENPYTEIQVPSSNGGTVEDESKSGNVGDIYATKESEDIAENYEYVSSTDNTSGEYIDGTIEVIYYYKEKEETEVIVHHYLYDESLGGYTEYQVAEDEEITGYVGKEYETESSETAKETYDVVSETPENYEGNMTKEVIEVTYYYVVQATNIENNITKTAEIEEDETLTDEEIKVAYNISYEVSIENYSGIATITIVDTLPYAIDEELSDIDEGKYEVLTDEEGNETYTITWTKDVTVEESYTNTIEKEIKVVYEDIDVTTSIENVVNGTVSTYYPDTYPVEEYQGKVKDQVDAEDTAEVEPKYTVKETAIEKTGTEVINSLTDEITYTINYTAIITNYEGDMLLTITDKLPYSINEELSQLDEGVYNFDDNTNTATITWQETIENANTDENGDYEINFSKTITVVYGEDLQLTKGTITNNVTGTIELYETDQTYTVEDSHDTEIKIPSTVIVKYVDINTGEEIEEEVEIEGYVGDEYETEEKEIEDYTFEEATENTEGEMTEDTIYVIYYYSKNEEEEPSNTNEDNTNTNDTNSVDENETNTNNIYANETNQNTTNDVDANNETTNNTNTSSSTGKTDPEENTVKTDPEESTSSNTDTTLPGTGGQGASTIIKIGVLIIIIGFIVSKVKIIRIDKKSNK